MTKSDKKSDKMFPGVIRKMIKNQPMHVSFNSNDNPNWKKDMGDLINILIRNGYTCEVYYDDVGIYNINYDYNKPEWGGPQLVWIDPNKEAVVDLDEEGNYKHE